MLQAELIRFSTPMKTVYIFPALLGSTLLLGAVCTTPLPQTNSATTNTSNTTLSVIPNRTFVSRNLNYTLSYPNSWYTWSGSDVYPEFDSKETDIDYLSTEDRVTGTDITGEGVSLAITYTTKIDQATGQAISFEQVVAEEMVPSVATKKETLTVGGLPAVKQFESDPRDPINEFGFFVTYYIDAPKGVYTFTAVATSEAEYERQAATIQSVVSSFTLQE